MSRVPILQVVGIWFYEEEEADKVESLLHRILAAYPEAQSSTDVAHEQVLLHSYIT